MLLSRSLPRAVIFYDARRSLSTVRSAAPPSFDRTIAGTAPHHAWSIFESALHQGQQRTTGLAAAISYRHDARLYGAMMAYCKRHCPPQSSLVLDAAANNGIAICENLFRAFINACLAATPPLLSDVLSAYQRYGPRTHDTIYGVAHVCRVAKRPTAVLPLIADARTHHVQMSLKLLTTFAASCAEAGTALAADTAEHLLSDIHSGGVVANTRTFGLIIKALLLQKRFDRAFHVLHIMDSLHVPPDIHQFTHVLSAHVKAARLQTAMLVFDMMADRSITATTPSFNLLLVACTRADNRDAIDKLFTYASQTGLLADSFIVSSFISVFGRNGRLSVVDELYTMSRSTALMNNSSVVTSFISAFGRNGGLSVVEDLYAIVRDTALMKDPFIVTSFISEFGRNGRLSHVDDLYAKTRKTPLMDDAFIVTSFISEFGRNGRLSAVEDLYAMCQCAVEAADAQRRSSPPRSDMMAGKMALMKDPFVVSALISAFGRNTRLDLAVDIFEASSSPTTTIYNSMIDVYAEHGMMAKAVAVFKTMKANGVTPVEVTLTVLLNGCSHVGDLSTALAIIDEFERKWKIALTAIPRNCLIDLYGRLGELDTAEEMAGDSMDDNAVSWMALLGACRKHNDIKRAERVFTRLLSLSLISDEHRASAHILMSNIYATAGRFEDVASIRRAFHTTGIAKVPGRTTLLLPDRSLEFVAGDLEGAVKSHHERMIRDLVRAGYQPDVALVTKSASTVEDAKESICGHSEKIALAYALEHLPPGEPIRAIKNLRVCTDCHEATKIMSSIYKREIHMRDANRHHHFRDGKCSCADYW